MKPLLAALAASIALVAPATGIAQPYPSRPVVLVVPFSAGGLARIIICAGGLAGEATWPSKATGISCFRIGIKSGRRRL